jgi:hypothetical protein
MFDKYKFHYNEILKDYSSKMKKDVNFQDDPIR